MRGYYISTSFHSTYQLSPIVPTLSEARALLERFPAEYDGYPVIIRDALGAEL